GEAREIIRFPLLWNQPIEQNLENIKPFQSGIHSWIFLLHVSNKKRIDRSKNSPTMKAELINQSDNLISVLEPFVLHIEVEPERFAKLLEHISEGRDAVCGFFAREQQFAAF